jgi:hypothetical protein
MSDIKKTSVTSPKHPTRKPPLPSDPTASKRLERDADKMAHRADKEERKYDENHDIFTK